MPLRPLTALLLALIPAAAAPIPAQDDVLGLVPGQEFVLSLSPYDDLRASVDFEAGSHGADMQDAQLSLLRAELVYGLLAENQLSFGFRDKEQARLVDVGDFRVPSVPLVRDRAPRPSASVLHSLRLDHRKVTYAAPVDKRLDLREATPLTAILPETAVRHVLPQLGHVYLLRYRGVDEVSDAWGRVVAFQVVELVPGQRLVLRGRILPGSP